VPLTGDYGILERGIARLDAVGGTAMRDAVETAETYLSEHGTRDRKVLVVVTDGIDNASSTTRDRIEKGAEVRDTAIFAIGLFGHTEHAGEGRHELDRLTDRSGGAAWYPSNIDQIEPVARTIAREIRSQYTIGYTPLNQTLDGSYRSIRVAVAGRERMTVHARTGYRATPGY